MGIFDKIKNVYEKAKNTGSKVLEAGKNLARKHGDLISGGADIMMSSDNEILKTLGKGIKGITGWLAGGANKKEAVDYVKDNVIPKGLIKPVGDTPASKGPAVYRPGGNFFK